MTQAHALPNVGSPPIMIQPLASASRIAMIRLSSRQVSLIDMSVLARWKIRPRLMGVHGVANVSIYGQRDRQLQVQVDPQRLRAKRRVADPGDRDRGQRDVGFAADVRRGVDAWHRRVSSSPPTSASPYSTSPRYRRRASFPRCLSRASGSGTLRLGDVSNVIEDHQPLIGDAVANGAPSLLLVIEKFPGASTLQVTRDIDAAMAAMAPGLKGITIDRPNTVRRRSSRRRCGTSAGSRSSASSCSSLALGLLASWRAALIGLIVVPVSLTLAAYVLYLRGTTFTTITLLGLAAAVCVVIDDVIVDIDAARRRIADQRRAAAGGTEPGSATTMTAAFAAVRGPLVFATLAILLATLPFLFLGTAVTAFSRPLVLTYAFAVLASMLVAFLLTPTLAALLLRGAARGQAGPVRGLGEADVRPRDSAAIDPVAPGLGGGRCARAGRAGGDARRSGAVRCCPSCRTAICWCTCRRPRARRCRRWTGLRPPRGTRCGPCPVCRAWDACRAGGRSDQLVDVNSAEMWITLDDQANYGRAGRRSRRCCADYPGLRTGLAHVPGRPRRHVMADQNNDLIVRVYGADLDVLQDKARQIRAHALRGTGGGEARRAPDSAAADRGIRVNLAAAQRYGLRPGDVRRDATTLTSGLIVGNLYEQSKIFDVVVWGAPQVRGDLTELGNLLIDTPSGGQVALKDVATVSVRPEPTAIIHNDVLRNVEVTAGVTGDPSAVVSAVRSRLAQVPMPYEYHAEVLGNATVQRPMTSARSRTARSRSSGSSC